MGGKSSKQQKSSEQSFQPGFAAQPSFSAQTQPGAGGGMFAPQAQSSFSAQPPPGFAAASQSSYQSQQMYPSGGGGGGGANQASFQSQPANYNQAANYQSSYTPSQQGFPPMPAMPSQPPASSAYQSSMFPQQTTSPVCYPVSYATQAYRPLIPGYAAAPANDQRRSNATAAQEQEQNEFANRYYGEQHYSQMPMHGSKRKH